MEAEQKKSVAPDIIKAVRENIHIPLIVGGGIRTQEQVDEAFQHGADMVVIGTALEQNPQALDNFKMKKNESIR
ncbi:MAG: geranylgeranylglyceryl/heptaprenylglyceryl phosphate synthase [Flavobacteriaceae bacterium]|nr:geranylgeranylglyceryl/heptaprenylglyceryl phosphate synthase [Flavobacteriaceae bacterium]